jgi:AcrR family transcriptional regulator
MGLRAAIADRGKSLRKSAAKEAARPRERILNAAYDLFARSGVGTVGIDTILAESGCAKASLYSNFDSKVDLAIAFLDKREAVWTRGWLETEVKRRASDPEKRLLAIFDVFDGWFHRDDYEGCSFINVVLEMPDPTDPIHRAGTAYLAGIRSFLEGLARAAGIPDAEAFARKWHILMKGSIIAAAEGDRDAARRAQEIGRAVLAAQR